MNLQTAIEIFEYHQEWRLGKREEMIHEPKKLTEALDIVLIEVKKLNVLDVCEHPEEALINDNPTPYCLACNKNIAESYHGNNHPETEVRPSFKERLAEQAAKRKEQEK